MIKVGNNGALIFAKFDPSGKTLWTKTVPAPLVTSLEALAICKNDNLVFSGNFAGKLTVGTDTVTNDNKLIDIYVAKLSADGVGVGVSAIHGDGRKYVNGIAVDQMNDIFVTGDFEGVLDFGTTNLVSHGRSDIFIAKQNARGQWLWAIGAGGTNLDIGKAIAVDSKGYCYVTGTFSKKVEFARQTITSTGDMDIFLCKISPDGQVIWVRDFGQKGYASGVQLAVSADGQIFFVAYASDSASFGGVRLNGHSAFLAGCDTNGDFKWVYPLNCFHSEPRVLLAGDVHGAFYMNEEFAQKDRNTNTFVLTKVGIEK